MGWSRACSEPRIRWRVVEQHVGCLKLEQSCHICVAVPVAERLWLNMRLFLKPAGNVIQHLYKIRLYCWGTCIRGHHNSRCAGKSWCQRGEIPLRCYSQHNSFVNINKVLVKDGGVGGMKPRLYCFIERLILASIVT